MAIFFADLYRERVIEKSLLWWFKQGHRSQFSFIRKLYLFTLFCASSPLALTNDILKSYTVTAFELRHYLFTDPCADMDSKFYPCNWVLYLHLHWKAPCLSNMVAVCANFFFYLGTSVFFSIQTAVLGEVSANNIDLFVVDHLLCSRVLLQAAQKCAKTVSWWFHYWHY